jgi:HAD superfamily hydrolase (TIGR01458 family)
LLEQGARRVACLVVEQSQDDIAGLELCHYPDPGSVDAVVLGDLAQDWTYDRLNWAFRLLLENPGAHLLALGMTRYCRSGNQLRLDVAPFVAALQCATDRPPRVMGKPGELMFRMALAQLDFPPAATIMVGDDIRSDIGGALEAGLQGVLVKTGKFRGEDLAGAIQPTAVIESIADFPRWYSSRRD